MVIDIPQFQYMVMVWIFDGDIVGIYLDVENGWPRNSNGLP